MTGVRRVVVVASALVILTMPAASVPAVRPTTPAPAGQGVTPRGMDAERTIPPCRCGQR